MTEPPANAGFSIILMRQNVRVMVVPTVKSKSRKAGFVVKMVDESSNTVPIRHFADILRVTMWSEFLVQSVHGGDFAFAASDVVIQLVTDRGVKVWLFIGIKHGPCCGQSALGHIL